MKEKFLHTCYTLVLTFLLGALFTNTNAQKETQIFGMAGYMINSDVTVARGELRFDNTINYSLGFDVSIDRRSQAEISWSMSPSYAKLYKSIGGTEDLTSVYIHHFQAGAIIEPNRKKDVSPFGLITLGASVFHPADEGDDQWTFTFALGGGVKLYVSDKIGIRLQGRLLVPMVLAGTSIWFGTGGAGVSVGTYTTIVEGDLSGGIFFRL